MADLMRQLVGIETKGWLSESRLFWILQLGGWCCFGCFLLACYWSFFGASFEYRPEFLKLGVALAFSFGLYWVCRSLWQAHWESAITIVVGFFCAVALAVAT